MVCRTPENWPLLRRWLPRLKWIAFHQVMFGNKKKSLEAKSGDEAAIRSVFRPVLLWLLRISELVRCHGERALFSSPNGAVFSSIQTRIGPINQHNTVSWLSFPSLNSCESQQRWPWPLRPIQPFSPSFEHVRRVKSTVLTVLSFVACSDGSMFRQQSRNGVETFSDCASTCPNSAPKLSCDFMFAPLWANAAPISPITFSCPIFRVGYFVCFQLRCLHVSNLSDVHPAAC